MYKHDQIKLMFNCTSCSKLLVDPVVISCGKTVCKYHLKEFIGQKTYKCKCCYIKHSVPDEGFVVSKFIQDQLKIQLNSIDINPVYEECKKEIEEAKTTINKINVIQNDPAHYISSYFEDIKTEVNIRRDVFKYEIDKYSDEIIQSVNENQANYIKLSKETSELKAKIKDSKKELNELIDQFDTLKIDEKKFHDIKDKVVALKKEFKVNLVELKSELLGHKEYSFIYVDQPIESIFGNITYSHAFKFNSDILNGNLSNELLKVCEFSGHQKWDLMYRATRDGFGADDFHSKCDGTNNTLTIIKSTNGNIFGGYSIKAWSSYHVQDGNSFLFSLVNKDNNPFKFEYNPKNPNLHPINFTKSCGPVFGHRDPYTDCNYDLYISSNSNANHKSYSLVGYSFYYGTDTAQPILAGSYYFQTVEIEVFTKIN